MLQNFVSNAIKYTREGRVLMGCRRHGNLVRIEVHDTGPGIPDSKLDVIFQEFQRLHTDGDGTSGLGLGLSIVERMAKVLEAPVHVSSKPGRGSMFAIDIPVAEGVKPAVAAEGRARCSRRHWRAPSACW